MTKRTSLRNWRRMILLRVRMEILVEQASARAGGIESASLFATG